MSKTLPPYEKLINVTIRLNPEVWHNYKDLQKHKGRMLVKAIGDMFRAAVYEGLNGSDPTAAPELLCCDKAKDAEEALIRRGIKP